MAPNTLAQTPDWRFEPVDDAAAPDTAQASDTATVVESAAKVSPTARALVLHSLLGLACVLVASYVGFGEFELSRASGLVFGPLAGIVAALACRRWWIAGPAALLGVAAGTVLGAAFSPAGHGTILSPAHFATVAALAALAGACAAALLTRRNDLGRWVARLGVALVVVAVCLYGWQSVTVVRSGGRTPAEVFASSPAISADTSDIELFIVTVQHMAAGEGYYSAMGRALVERDVMTLRSGVRAAVDLRNPTAFRMPTLYWLLSALPVWQGWVSAMLLLVTAAIIAAWSIASRYTHSAVALAGTAITGIYLAGFTSFTLPLAELWAGALGLIGVALALKSLSVRRSALAWAGTAAAVALLATLTRELAVGFLLIGLASSLVAERTRSRLLWFPWTVGLGLAAIGYTVHAQAAVAAARAFPALEGATSFSRIDPTGKGLLAALVLTTGFAWWGLGTAWVLWALGTLGGILAPSDWPRRTLLGGITLGGAIALYLLHPNAAQGSPVPGYWGYVVLPTVIACVPLAFARLPGLGREPGGPGRVPNEQSVGESGGRHASFEG